MKFVTQSLCYLSYDYPVTYYDYDCDCDLTNVIPFCDCNVTSFPYSTFIVVIQLNKRK